MCIRSMGQEDGTATDVVRYECIATSHQEVQPIRQGGLTVHRGGWAYCETESPDTPHQWVPTGGISLELLKRRPRRPRTTETTT
jgi:hypothetical protein